MSNEGDVAIVESSKECEQEQLPAAVDAGDDRPEENHGGGVALAESEPALDSDITELVLKDYVYVRHSAMKEIIEKIAAAAGAAASSTSATAILWFLLEFLF